MKLSTIKLLQWKEVNFLFPHRTTATLYPFPPTPVPEFLLLLKVLQGEGQVFPDPYLLLAIVRHFSSRRLQLGLKLKSARMN